MRPERREVKEWLKTVDREELDNMLASAIFTPEELKYIHARVIEGKSFKLIAISEGLSKAGMAKKADAVARKMYKALKKNKTH